MDIANLEPNQNIIYITEEEHRSEWTYDATKELLKVYDEKSDMLETGIITTQKKLWELTAKALARKGYYYTGPQCENKWKALKRSYKSKLEKMEKFGACKRVCPFEYEVAEILSKRPNDSITRSYSLKINELKKQEDIFSVNLNEPPGFSKPDIGKSYFKQETEDIKNIELIHEHSESSIPEVQLSENSEPTYTVIQDSSQSLLIEEISDLKKVQEKIFECLESAVEAQNKSLEIEQAKIAQQNEIIQQMKIQNDLLQKLLEKFS
ncbi:hypothetical protein NQ314_014675 [Rhamnusium bicolor]|uniref:Myb-like domain-containing protein n=1 Tax=Rhamnusium bicolor TaxID=1586634 RepID=A0AAV8X126_9CUCU|nr:hypothetical protein NQ314_014675 [Rhamnusium bicolor]